MSDPTHETPAASKAAEPDPANGVENPTNGVAVDAPVDWKALVPRLPCKPDGPPPAEMTIGQAAEYLGKSPIYILKLVKKGELPCRTVKKRRRIPRIALEAHKEKLYQQARIALSEMTQWSQDMGLYDDEFPQ